MNAGISVERFKLTLVGDINGLIGPFPAVEASPHGDFIHHSDYATLLHQLAERDAEVAELREVRDGLLRDLATTTDTLAARAEAAERAREEACGLLREYAACGWLDNDAPKGLADRIAAFLAASGGA